MIKDRWPPSTNYLENQMTRPLNLFGEVFLYNIPGCQGEYIICIYLVVRVDEVLDYGRQDVGWDGILEQVAVLLTVHGEVRHLLHQLSPDHRLYNKTMVLTHITTTLTQLILNLLNYFIPIILILPTQLNCRNVLNYSIFWRFFFAIHFVL